MAAARHQTSLPPPPALARRATRAASRRLRVAPGRSPVARPVRLPAGAAVQSVRVSVDADAIDLARAVEHTARRATASRSSTAPGADGIVRRSRSARWRRGRQPAWIVFALTNNSDEQLTRLIVAPHFRLVGSGVVWPDLGSSRITTITASQGKAPSGRTTPGGRVPADPRSGHDRDLCGGVRTPSLPQLYLWEPDAYKDKATSLTLTKASSSASPACSRFPDDRVRRARR